MGIVKGENVVVRFFDSGRWKMYACGRTSSLTITTDTLETSGPGTGIWRTFIPTLNSFTGSIDGLVNLDTDNFLSLSDLRAKQVGLVPLLMQYERTDSEGNVYIDQATFIITSSADTGNFADVASFSISLQGTGAITTTFVPSPSTGSKVNVFNYTGAGGESSFSSSVLIGKSIVGAFKDGVSFKVITSGSPSDKIVVYTSSTGTFAWPIEFETGELSEIQYQDL